MADTHGLVKLGDALRWFRLDWFFGVNDGKPTMQCSGVFIDQDELRVTLECFMDLKTGEVWVQLPLVTVDAIVCQAGEDAKRTELDTRLSSTQRIAPPGGAKETTGVAQRRAPSSECDWHQNLKRDYTRDHFDASQCTGCRRWFKDEHAILKMTIVKE